MAGRYCAGSAELHMAEFFQKYLIPNNLVPGDEDASFNAQVVFEEQLAKIWEPARESAIVTLEQAIALSEKQGRWTKWTQLALDDLSALDPKSYPPQKQEVLYPMNSVFVAPAGPISMDSPNLIKQSKVEQSEESVETVEETGNSELDSTQQDGQEPSNVGEDNQAPNDLGWGEAAGSEGEPSPSDSDGQEESPESNGDDSSEEGEEQ